jgi:hypothetical protein
MKLRYVFSAPGMFSLNSCGREMDNPEEYIKFAEMVKEGVDLIRTDINKKIDGVKFGMDVLFNAFTEKYVGEWLRKYDTFGFEKLYADSGGLQIVTLGKQIDDEMKYKIYGTQSCADFAMCFDEIPVRVVNAFDSKSNRTVIGNRLYYPSLKKESAIKTANNIKEQIEILDKFKTDTLVHYIVQGNNHQDMYEWFDDGVKILTDKHFEKIGGVSIGFVCLGNGQLESIEMLVGYHRIVKDFGIEKTKKHVHLLGFGSVKRLLPVLYIMKSKLLPDDLTISFDSTSFSMSYIMGRFTDDEGKEVGKDPEDVRRMFEKVYNYFQDIYHKHVPNLDKEKFIDHLVKEVRSIANTINNAPDDMRPVVHANTVLTTCWQLVGFAEQVKRILQKAENDNSPLGMIKHVKDFNDYEAWHREFGKFVKSNRVKRESFVTLDNFFE